MRLFMRNMVLGLPSLTDCQDFRLSIGQGTLHPASVHYFSAVVRSCIHWMSWLLGVTAP